MTSGLGLDSHDRARRWFSMGVKELAVPMYGYQADLHDQITGSINFDRLMSSLKVAHQAGMRIRIHTLALNRNLHAIEGLAQLVQKHFGTRLSVAPPREKAHLFQYEEETPNYQRVSEVLCNLDVELVGWPRCVAPDRPRGAAMVIELYMRGQARDYAKVCKQCLWRTSCSGVVLAELQSRGSEGLNPKG